MALWKFGKPKGEKLASSYLAERLADIFDPAVMIQRFTAERLPFSSPSDLFLALASLRLVGFSLGLMQDSITRKVDRKVRKTIHDRFAAALMAKHPRFETFREGSDAPFKELYALASKVELTFFAHVKKPTAEAPPPHWFAAKEVCIFLQHDDRSPNPEFIMTFGSYLQDTVIGTKEMFDELLAINVEFVE